LTHTEHAFWVGDVFVPQTLKEAKSCPDSVLWENTMNEELASLSNNDTFTVCKLPKGRKAVSAKWVYTIKSDGRYKARLVARGFAQVPGVDYEDTFSPTLRMSTFRMLLSQSVQLGLDLIHMDVVTAFLHGSLQEELYLKIPANIQTPSNKGSVFKLNKAIYGLKQASRQWFKRFHDFILRQGFQQSEVDPCLYTKQTSKGITLVAIYVDGLLIASNSPYDSVELQAALSAEFQMKHLGAPACFLGIQIEHTKLGFLIHQADLIDKILKRFDITDVATASTPMDPKIKFDKSMSGSPSFHGEYQHAIGCLQYLVTCSRLMILLRQYPYSLHTMLLPLLITGKHCYVCLLI